MRCWRKGNKNPKSDLKARDAYLMLDIFKSGFIFKPLSALCTSPVHNYLGLLFRAGSLLCEPNCHPQYVMHNIRKRCISSFIGLCRKVCGLENKQYHSDGEPWIVILKFHMASGTDQNVLGNYHIKSTS